MAIVTSERGLTPFGLVIAESESSPFQSLVEDSPVSVMGNRLSIGNLTIETRLASSWSPTPDWAALGALFSSEPDRLRGLVALAISFATPGSLLDLYLRDSQDDPDRIPRALRQRSMKGVFDLDEGLRANNKQRCIKGVRLLAGLGGGLTPAGDDFIVGTLLAMWAGMYGPGREALVQSIAETAAPLTTTLSAAYLRAAARGECVVQWHRLFTALQGFNPEETQLAVKSLLSIGHSSGADGLAGFLAVRLFQ